MEKESKLTAKKIEEYLIDIFQSKKKSSNDFAMTTGCNTKGFVTRTEKDLQICDDPECTSCRLMDKAMKETANDFLNINTKQKQNDKSRNISRLKRPKR